MLISVRDLAQLYGVNPEGVLHLGAHLAEEENDYIREGWARKNKIIWVESQSKLVEILRSKLDPKNSRVIEATIWSEQGINLIFKETNNSQSSSVLNLRSHAEKYPEIIVVSEYNKISTTLNELFPGEISFDFINLDLQGAELKALEGFGQLPKKVKWIYTEINKEELYEKCARIDELDAYLGKQGFRRVASQWVIRKGWGDALYARENSIKTSIFTKTIIFIKYKILLNSRSLVSSMLH
jgi:FkbM family methyltransferase